MLLGDGVCYDQCGLFEKPLLAFDSKTKLGCYSRCLLTFYFCIPVLYDEKDTFVHVCMLVLEGLIGFTEPFNFSFFYISVWGINLY